MTIRSGARSSGQYLLVHASLGPLPTPAADARVGFVVSKAVGNAVVRNRVKRRLRAALAPSLQEFPQGSGLVVRAKPSAANATFADLSGEIRRHSTRAITRAARTERPVS